MKAIKLLVISIFLLIPVSSAYANSGKTMDHYIPMDEELENHWAYEEIDDLINADIVDGFMDSDNNMFVKPENSISRAEFVKLVVSALGLESNGSGKTFPDVKSGQWYSEFVQIASSLEIIDGKPSGKFAPNDKITRAEMTKVIVLAFGKTVTFPTTDNKKFTDVGAKYWATEFISKASGAGIVNGYGDVFKPVKNATRAEAMAMIHRALQKEQSHVAEDTDLIEFLGSFIQKQNDYAEGNNFDELMGLYQENSTGYFAVEGLEYNGIDFILENSDEFTFTINDNNMTLKVLNKSNRFATLEVTGMKATVVYKGGSTDLKLTEDIDGIYNLKKDAVTGNWKVYNYLPYFTDLEL